MVQEMNYDLENPGNIRERLMIYSDFIRKADERKKAEEASKENEGKEV